MSKRLASVADLDSVLDEFEKDIAEVEQTAPAAAADNAVSKDLPQQPSDKQQVVAQTPTSSNAAASSEPDRKRKREVISAAPKINQFALARAKQQETLAANDKQNKDSEQQQVDPLTLMAYNPAYNPDFQLARQQQQLQQARAQTSSEQTYSYVYQGENTRTLEQQKVDKKKRKKVLRTAAGETWEDPSMQEWADNDHRIFVGDLGNDVTDEVLSKAFSHYKSFSKAKVVRDKRTTKSKGFGFVSFLDAEDYVHALMNMNGKYIGSRPCTLSKSTWKDRTIDGYKEKERKKQSFV